MRISFSQTGRNGFGISQMQNRNEYDPSKKTGASSWQETTERRRMLSQSRQQTQSAEGMPKVFQGRSQTSVAGDIQKYGDAIRAGRTKSKDTSTQMKQLRYNFKAISSQIMRSKTSANARQVAGKARREVQRLKRLRQSGGYDQDDLECAITHAQAMERVAKKKAIHLREEELAKTGEVCEGELKEKEEYEERTDELEQQTQEQQNLPEDEEALYDENEILQQQMEEYESLTEEISEMLMEADPAAWDGMMSDVMEGMMDEMWDAMKEMLEDMGLEDLMEEMSGGVERDMDPEDLKMMKIKHRAKEMKAITQADSEYLKAVFDKMEKAKALSVAAMKLGGATGGGSAVSFSPGSFSAVSDPAAGIPAPPSDMGDFNITV